MKASKCPFEALIACFSFTRRVVFQNQRVELPETLRRISPHDASIFQIGTVFLPISHLLFATPLHNSL